MAKSQSLLLKIKKNSDESFKYNPEKYFDKIDYKLLTDPKKVGTFMMMDFLSEKMYLYQKLNGKEFIQPLDEILTPVTKQRTLVVDSLPKTQAKFLYETKKGKVYTLPLYNLPCLVPDINSNMPIAKSNLKGYKKMPNAFPEQKLIPSESLIEPYYKK